MQKLFECSPATIALCRVIFYLVAEDVIHDNEKMSTIGRDSAYPLTGFL